MTLLPSLSELISHEAIPSDIGILAGAGKTVEQVLETLLKGIRYKDLVIQQSPDGDVKTYALTIVSKEVGFKFPGTDVSFLAFPGAAGSGSANVPVEFEWRWGLKRYIRDVEAALVAPSASSIFKLFLRAANISEAEFINGLVAVFFGQGYDGQRLVTEIRDYISEYQSGALTIDDADGEILNKAPDIISVLNALLAEFADPATTPEQPLEHITSVISGLSDQFDIDFDLATVAFEALTRTVTDPEKKMRQVIGLFGRWFSGLTSQHVQDILVPQISLTIAQIPMALEFPRKWLVPLDQNDQPIEDELVKSRLSYNAGSLTYSTRNGLKFTGENSFQFNKSGIGNTGLTLKIVDARVDFSRTTNIPEATAAGYPVEFVGVYVKYLEIGLPAKWFAKHTDPNDPTTLGVVGRNLLIGTGGISGTIGLEALSTSGTPAVTKTSAPVGKELEFVLGKGGKGFKIGFSQFHMKWQQNTLVESDVKGSITIPNFKSCNAAGVAQAGPLKIGVTAHFEQDGDFQVTAKPTTDLRFCLEDVLIVKVDGVEVGKHDDHAYLSTSGEISFANNKILSSILKDPIVIKKLKIYSDGTFDIEGGTIPLPKGARLKLGPTEVYITNLTLGSGERNHNDVLRKYKNIGFSCGLSAGSAGLDLRGDGIEFWFTVDGSAAGEFHCFMRISGIGIDLIIPGSAAPENAAVIIKGYLSIKEDEYIGAIDIKLPKIKIAGGAAMRMRPKVPAWIIDAYLELSVPIPLGALPLGIYGFRGMFGYRYIATKEAAGLTQNDSWVDYYVADKPPGGKGVHVGKMLNPEATPGAKAPISIGAGLSLATSADSGFTFSIQAFLLISLPELIMIQGKANILGTRVGLTDGDPPFFAMVAFSPGHSLEFGLGVDYKLRKDGQLLDLYAEVRAAYYFQDSSAWFVHFGTKEKPITARILALFNGYSYLMLSARGIEAGAGVTFGFEKKYGPVSAKVAAYFDIWGYLSFQGVQIGAGLALGGQVDVSIWGIGFGISIATMLEGTVPRPFRIAGSIEVCVYVKVLIKKFEKCFNVDFVWERNNDHEIAPISPMPLMSDPNFGEPPVSAYHLGSGKTYSIQYFGDHPPKESDISSVIPLDTYVDFIFKKGVDANAVAAKLGGVTNAPTGNVDTVPPKPSYNDVEHRYKIQDINIEVFVPNLSDPSLSQWVSYHPYEALTAGSTIAGSTVDLSALRLGNFQKTDLVYNKVRLLSQTPFSYMETSSGGYIPEQMGLTSGMLFCKQKERKWNCVTWAESKTFSHDQWYFNNGVTVQPVNKDSKVVAFSNVFGVPKSLYLQSGSSVEFLLPKSSVKVNLKLFSFAESVTISYQYVERTSTGVMFHEIATITKVASDLLQEVLFESVSLPVDKVVVTPAFASELDVFKLRQKIDLLQEQIYHQTLSQDEGAGKKLSALNDELNVLVQELKSLTSIGCFFSEDQSANENYFDTAIKDLNAQLSKCNDEIAAIETLITTNCGKGEFSCNCLTQPPRNGNQDHLLACLEKLNRELKSRPEADQKSIELIASLIQQQNDYITKFGIELKDLLSILEAHNAAQFNQCQKWQRQNNALKANCIAIKASLSKIEVAGGTYYPSKEVTDCGTYIHELCWLTEEDHYFNQSIPSQVAIEEDFSMIKAASEQVISPIWRPDSTYRIRIDVSDSVDGGSDHLFPPVYAGFKTKGPIGHYPMSDANPPTSPAPTTNPPTFDDRINVAETSLKFYIDAERSYPYGTLIGAKPLYYQNPKLLLFFTKPFVSHFFGTWPAYKGLPEKSANMEIVVKDPTEGHTIDNTNLASSQVMTTLPTSTLNWDIDLHPIIPEDIKIYGSLRNPEILNPNFPGATCWQSGGDPIVPASKSISYTVADLKPLKLYTAVVKNHFDGKVNDVHTYAFQTSRFLNFKEHINSYHLKDKNGLPTRSAIFDVSVELNQLGSGFQSNLLRALEIVKNTPGSPSPYNEQLTATYPDPFQRLMEGHLAFKTLSPSLGLEFNFLKDSQTDRTFAIYINSVEPLNDPRIPRNDLMGSVSVIENGIPRPDYWVLFSKDCSKAVLMNSAMEIAVNDLRIRFGQLQWDGNEYQEVSFVITDNLRF
jgi:hypothetical protein